MLDDEPPVGPDPGQERLSRERIVRAAVALADAEGIPALTMRRLAQRMGTKVMSLYYHVADKDDLLAAMTTDVLGEIGFPPAGSPWKRALRDMAIGSHAVLLRHPWAAGLMLSPGGAGAVRLAYMEWVLRTLRQAGFSATTTDRAYHAIESHIMGFTLWVVAMDLGSEEQIADLARGFLDRLSREDYPYVAEHIEQHLLPRAPGVDFAFGLDLILDGLEAQLEPS